MSDLEWLKLGNYHETLRSTWRLLLIIEKRLVIPQNVGVIDPFLIRVMETPGQRLKGEGTGWLGATKELMGEKDS